MAKILIVDDDVDIVESTKVVLESRGHEVSSASSGKEGLEKTKKDKPLKPTELLSKVETLLKKK